MIQQIRSNKILPSATTEKLLLNDTPSNTVPTTRTDGLTSAAIVLALIGYKYANPLLTDDGYYLVTDEGDYRAYVD